MEVEVVMALLANLGIVGSLFRWQHVQIRDNKLEVAKVSLRVYSKHETNDMIDLKLQPLAVGIAHVQEDLKDVKTMLGKLLDEKNKG